MINDQTANNPAPAGAAAWAVFLPPALLGAIVLVVLAGSAFGWHPLWPAGTVTLSEAVVLRDFASVHTMIAAGADPNATHVVRAEMVKSAAVELTPLEAAVSTRELYLVEALLARGARIDDATRIRLACFARQENAEAVAAFLAESATAPIHCTGVSLPW